MRQAIKDYKSPLLQATRLLNKQRGHTQKFLFSPQPQISEIGYLPTLKNEELYPNATRTQDLEIRIKEKHLLIGILQLLGTVPSYF